MAKSPIRQIKMATERLPAGTIYMYLQRRKRRAPHAGIWRHNTAENKNANLSSMSPGAQNRAQ